ncbi:MAG: hypothetical protein ACXV3F_17010, partial [Frankiaceae bacterium]
MLQSLAYAGWQARSRVIGWGVRSYALGGGLGRSTVAVLLAELAAEADPLLVRVAAGVHDQADTFRLRLPDTVSLRRAGPTLKPRPVPDVLIDRPKSGLGVYQALSSRPRTADELAARSRYGGPPCTGSWPSWPSPPAAAGTAAGCVGLVGWSPPAGAPAATGCGPAGCVATAGNAACRGTGSTAGTARPRSSPPPEPPP